MKTFKTLIYNHDKMKKEIIEVKGYNINDTFFAYKDEKGYYFLVDKKTGYSVGKFDKLKELKIKVPEMTEKINYFIKQYEVKYKYLIHDFNEIINKENNYE